jgi:fibronectin-binding autotransporter adhesin
MKNTSVRVVSILLIASALGCSTARAQHYGDYWDGGSGTWNTTNTNWDGNNVYYNSNNRTDIATPVFSGTGGTVTVDESGGALYNGIMIFNSGNWTLQGDVINSISTDYQAQVVVMNPGSGNVTINNTINIAPNPTNGGSSFVNDSVGSTLTLGNINISSVPQSGTDGSGATYTNVSAPFEYNNGSSTNLVNSQTPELFAYNGTTIVIDGNYTTDPNLYGGLLIGYYGDSDMETGTYIFKGDLDESLPGEPNAKQFDFGSGNIIFDTSETGTGNMTFVGAGANLPQTLLTEGAQTISNNIYNQGASNAIIGGSDASASIFSGNINAGGSGGELDLRAAAGGTVTFSGQISGDNGATTKDGSGTVILSNPGGNTWTTYIPDAFEMKAGTTIITNTSGDAFGNGAANSSVGPTFVQLDAGAKLAGTGITTQTLNAVGATSEISPGLSNKIGLMSLGGLTATSGLTMDFKLNGDLNGAAAPVLGVNNDFLQLGAGNFSLGGTVTINLTAMDTLATGPGNVYTLFTSGGNVTGDPIFDVIAPTGYALDTSYGLSDGLPDGLQTGYNYSSASGTFSVELVATPEPSTYCLMGLGLLALVGIRHWKRRGQLI